MGLKMRGLQKLNKQTMAHLRNTDNAARDAIVDVGNSIMQESKVLVPVDSGHLKSSARVRVEDRPNRRLVDLEYTAPYAFIVHEKPGEKFLEKPLLDRESRIIREIGDAMRRHRRG
mgnify:CR=1 FL=1